MIKTAYRLAITVFVISVAVYLLYLTGKSPDCFEQGGCNNIQIILSLLAIPINFIGLPIVLLCTPIAFILAIVAYLKGADKRLVMQSFLYLILPAIVTGTFLALFI